MAGDQWILGFSPQVNEDLQALLAGVRTENLTTIPEPLPDSLQRPANAPNLQSDCRRRQGGVASGEGRRAGCEAGTGAEDQEGKQRAAEARAAKKAEKLATSVAA